MFLSAGSRFPSYIKGFVVGRFVADSDFSLPVDEFCGFQFCNGFSIGIIAFYFNSAFQNNYIGSQFPKLACQKSDNYQCA